MIAVTVAICTWNRAALLDRTLTRLLDLRVPAGLTWEVVVVDNNSADGTAAVLARHAGRLPLVPLTESKQGHSHARNRAVAAARGALILWTDDDVLVDPEWLARMTAAAGAHPEAQFFGGPIRPWFGEAVSPVGGRGRVAQFFGGPIRPWFESPPPAWLKDNLDVLGFCFALIDHGPVTHVLAPGEYAYGANVGFRKAVMDRYPFDPALGRVGSKLSSGDDTRVQDQVVAAGGHGVWVGDAAVEHFLPAARMTVAYVREVLFWAGYHGFAPFAADTSPRLFGAPRWVWQKYLVASVRRRLGGRRKDRAWVRALRDEAKFAGLVRRFREGPRA